MPPKTIQASTIALDCLLQLEGKMPHIFVPGLEESSWYQEELEGSSLRTYSQSWNMGEE